MYRDSAQFLPYWRNARIRTTRVLGHLRESDIEWTYEPKRFTFGDLFRHLAGIERYMFAENAKLRASLYPGHSATLASGLEEVRSYVTKCHREALEIFSTLSLADLESKCTTPAGQSITVWKWLRSMVEHEAHHRGQLYLMARMRGISIEPLYGLTEEQVQRRSQSDDDAEPSIEK